MRLRAVFLLIGALVVCVLLALLALLLRSSGAPFGAGYAVAQDDDYPYCVWVESETQYHLFPCPDDSTPTAPPSPSLTPSPTSTSTSTATPTPTATATAPTSATPTQELTPPAPTFTVTPPPLKVCTLRANGHNMNVRTHAGTEYPPIPYPGNVWNIGTESVFDLFAYDNDLIYLWGRHAEGVRAGGWSAIYQPNINKWYIDGTESAVFCPLVEGWPPGLDPPPPIAFAPLGGPHTIIGEGGSAPLNYAANLGTGKYTPGVFHLAAWLKEANPDAWIVCRLFTDSIALDHDYDPLEVWLHIKDAIPAVCDAFELENEHTPRTVDQWERWSPFSIGMAKLLQQNKNMQYCAFSFGPGWPQYHELEYIVPYLEWVAANPLPDGRYHCVASHAAMYAPWDRADMPWVNSLHIAGRVYMMRDVMLATWGFDLATWPGMWAITEGGLSDGYSGNWDAPYTCEEAASAYRATLAEYARRGYPHALHWWNFGKAGIWTSDHDCARLMFG